MARSYLPHGRIEFQVPRLFQRTYAAIRVDGHFHAPRRPTLAPGGWLDVVAPANLIADTPRLWRKTSGTGAPSTPPAVARGRCGLNKNGDAMQLALAQRAWWLRPGYLTSHAAPVRSPRNAHSWPGLGVRSVRPLELPSALRCRTTKGTP